MDKTGIALRLIDEGKYYFLSRPRRFGKSLFLDALAALFEGNAALFAGLEAEGRWDWSRRFPVIRLSLAEGVLRNRLELDEKIVVVLVDEYDKPILDNITDAATARAMRDGPVAS